MNPFVSYQVRNLGECAMASFVVAWVWLLLIVDALVLLQRAVLRKGLVALIAVVKESTICGPSRRYEFARAHSRSFYS